MRIICLHGFLGLPSDWSFLGPALMQRGFDCQIVSLDLWSFVPSTFENVSKEIALMCRPDDILLGYSMGGRVASQVFFIEQACKPQGGLVMVSAHYGGLTREEAPRRTEHDQKWARRFETDKWEVLLKDWNAQPVFNNDGPTGLFRREEDFKRSDLAHALTTWTVANQPDTRPAMSNDTRPVLWMAGEYDTKYAGVTQSLDGCSPNLHTRVVSGAGHRLPWSAQDKLLDELCSYLEKNFGDDRSSK